MPRTWGYIILIIATAIGVGALVLPMPETVVVAKLEEPAKEEPVRRPPPAQGRTRPKATPPKPEPPKPAAKTFPKQNTTSSRQTVKPKPKS